MATTPPTTPPSPARPATPGPRGAADLPWPVEAWDLSFPTLPPALDGLTILHLADFHVSRKYPSRLTLPRLLDALPTLRPDLVLVSGDMMNHPGDEEVALAFLSRLEGAWRPRLGAFGVFGNHDSHEFQAQARTQDQTQQAQAKGRAGDQARPTSAVRWLCNESARVDVPAAGAAPGSGSGGAASLRILGISEPEDLLHAALAEASLAEPADQAAGAGPASPADFTIVLAHFPTFIYPAAAMGLPLVLAGHTHGGQVRLSPHNAPHTSCDLPKHLAAGVLRLGGTLGAVTRGLGEVVVDLRLNCPPQAPLYTLRRGPLPGRAAAPLHAATAW